MKAPAPAYTTAETARAIYLLARGALAAIRGQDPAGSRWDERLSDLARTARKRDEEA